MAEVKMILVSECTKHRFFHPSRTAFGFAYDPMELLLLHKNKSVKIGLIGTMAFLIGIAHLSLIQFP
jgi:hypothetical protein